MTEGEVIRHWREHLETQFPKTCAHCQRSYTDLRDFVSNTKQLGQVMPYDAELGDWKPVNPIGTMLFANCACRNTLVLTSKGMALPLLWQLLHWARIETLKRQITPTALFTELREKMHRRLLAAHKTAAEYVPGLDAKLVKSEPCA